MTDKKYNKTIKIAFIGSSHCSACERAIDEGLFEQAARMSALGHDVTIYSNALKQKEHNNVKIVTIPSFSGAAGMCLFSFLAAASAVVKRPNVIFFSGARTCISIPVAKLFGRRCVALLHSMIDLNHKRSRLFEDILFFGEKMAAQKADTCVVRSRHMKKYLKVTYDTDAVLSTIGVARTEKSQADQITKNYGLKKDGYLLSTASGETEMSLVHLINAFRNCETDKKLVVYCGESQREDYIDILTLNSGDSRILFVEDNDISIKRELYSNAYAFILPGEAEGNVSIMLEAMAYGNCCLVSDIPENVEMASSYAFFFKNSNPADLQYKIELLLENDASVSKTKSRAGKYAVENFDWDIVTEQMLRIYSDEKPNRKDTRTELFALDGCLNKE